MTENNLAFVLVDLDHLIQYSYFHLFACKFSNFRFFSRCLCVRMPYILITHSSVYRHLGRFHFQMIVDKIAMNIPPPAKKAQHQGRLREVRELSGAQM